MKARRPPAGGLALIRFGAAELDRLAESLPKIADGNVPNLEFQDGITSGSEHM
jgi:hypothetical protein